MNLILSYTDTSQNWTFCYGVLPTNETKKAYVTSPAFTLEANM